MKERRTTDRRRHARFELFEFTQIMRESDDALYPSLIVDVSLGGLQTRSRQSFTPGEKCILLIGRGGESPVMLHAEVRYSGPVEDDDQLIATGFRFQPRSSAERMALVDYVHDIFQREGERLIQ